MAAWSSIPPICHDSTEQPWIIWEKKTSLIGLSTAEIAETSASGAEMHSIPVHMNSPEPVINRNQYQTVMNRISAAQRKAGTFCSV